MHDHALKRVKPFVHGDVGWIATILHFVSNCLFTNAANAGSREPLPFDWLACNKQRLMQRRAWLLIWNVIRSSAVIADASCYLTCFRNTNT